MDTENHPMSDNFEDHGRSSALELWVGQQLYNIRQAVTSALSGPQKDTRTFVPSGPDPSDDPHYQMDNYVMATWYNLREAQPEYLARMGEEFVNARRLIDAAEAEHGYLNDNEALSAYLYDLDSRGIRMTSTLGQDGKWRMGMTVSEYDYAGNRIADETIAQSRALVESRELHAFAQSVIDGRPSVGDITVRGPIPTKTF
ncbi:MAG: hypothetical protein KDI65_07150 [Alphaproteobacteria bacterium]|nr:hypothetical protein [Alphaproteobacteria bacterium]